MKRYAAMATLLAMVAFLTGAAASLDGGVPPAVNYVGHDEISAMLAKGGLNTVVKAPGLLVVVNRKGSSPPEYHEHSTHIFIVIDGEATFVVGGTMVGVRKVSPDKKTEWAESIQGGQTYHLSKGDVITVPEKTPHWYKEVPSKTISYYAVNIESQ